MQLTLKKQLTELKESLAKVYAEIDTNTIKTILKAKIISLVIKNSFVC